jgi:hypothetical protein
METQLAQDGLTFLVYNFQIQPKVRRVVENGRSYLVAPITSLVPGVLPGSKGPLYYPPNMVQGMTNEWDGIPLTAGHPSDPITNENLSAKDDGVLRRVGLGFLRNSTFTDRMRHEAWFDEANTQRKAPGIYNRLLGGQPIECSTGLYTAMDEVTNGQHNGRPYTHVVTSATPDHMAILENEQGACSIRDGCGVLVNKRKNPFVRNDWSEAARLAAANARRMGGGTPDHLKESSDYANYVSKQVGEGKATHAMAARAHEEAAADQQRMADTGRGWGEEQEAQKYDHQAELHRRAAAEHRKESGGPSAGEALSKIYAKNRRRTVNQKGDEGTGMVGNTGWTPEARAVAQMARQHGYVNKVKIPVRRTPGLTTLIHANGNSVVIQHETGVWQHSDEKAYGRGEKGYTLGRGANKLDEHLQSQIANANPEGHNQYSLHIGGKVEAKGTVEQLKAFSGLKGWKQVGDGHTAYDPDNDERHWIRPGSAGDGVHNQKGDECAKPGGT